MFTGSVGIGWSWLLLPGCPAVALLVVPVVLPVVLLVVLLVVLPVVLPLAFAAAGIAMPTNAANAAMSTVIQVNRLRLRGLTPWSFPGGPRLPESKENLFLPLSLEIGWQLSRPALHQS
jgi:hypothetical protein